MDKSNQATPNYRHWGNVSRSILNGVIGDYLVKENNPLAIDMGFYYQNRPILVNDAPPEPNQKLLPPKDCTFTNKVVVLLHGLTNLETIWEFNVSRANGSELDRSTSDVSDPDSSDSDSPETTETSEPTPVELDNYGTRLQNDFGYTPLYLRYNTGLPIEESGQQFAALMDRLMEEYPMPIDEIVIIGFSMGGLLMRYAQKIAGEQNTDWLPKLRQCFYLGTPHEGSPVEKFGHMVSSIVRAIPRDYVSQWADWIDVRSEGIQDLKHGVLHFNQPDDDLDLEEVDPLPCGSFYDQASHYFVSGSLSPESDSLVNKFFGDSLVRHSSANPITAPEGSQFAHFDGVPHIPLAHSRRIYRQIKTWVEEKGSEVTVKEYSGPAAEPLPQDLLMESNPSTKEVFAGTLDLLAVGYEKTIDAIEKMHLYIGKEPHAVLHKIPVTKPVAVVVDVTYTEVSNSVFSAVRQVGKLIKGASTVVKASGNTSNDGTQ